MFAKVAIGAAVAASFAVSGHALMPRVPRVPVHTQPAQQREMPSRSITNASEAAAVSGRAMRTMARLAMKIELAEQRGDEVSVPGWTDEDDAALVSAIVDFFGAAMFCNNAYGWRGVEGALAAEDLLPLLRSDDKDIRIGAALVGVYISYQFNEQPPDELIAALREAASDPDPEVRAAGVYSLIQTLIRIPDHRDELTIVLDAAIEDEAIEVRFAAAMFGSKHFFDKIPQLEKILNDESAIVRFTASIAITFRWFRPGEEGEKWRLAEMILTDPNPIARSAAFPLVGRFFRTDEERAELAGLVENIDDEWLKLNPMAAMMQPPGNDFNLDAISDLAASPKRSHRALAACSLFAMMTTGRAAVPGDEGEPRPPEAARPPEPVDLWSRAALLFLSSFGDQNVAKRLWIEALQSDDESARLSSLLAIPARSEAGAPAALIEGIESSFRRGVYAEKAAAVQAMSSLMTYDQFTDAFQRAVDDGAGRAELALFIEEFIMKISSLRDPAEQAEQLKIIIDVIIRADDPHLTATLARNGFFVLPFHSDRGRIFFTYLMEKAQPEAVLLILDDSQANFLIMRNIIQILSVDGKLHILTARLEEIAASPDADIRDGTVGTLKNILTGAYFARSLSDQDRQAMEGLMVRTAHRQMELGEDGINRAIGILAAFLAPQGYPYTIIEWKDAGPELRAIMLDSVGRAADQVHRAQAAEVLYGLYRQNGRQTGWDIAQHDPGLRAAMERARQTIMEHGEPAEQIAVMCGIIQGHFQEDIVKRDLSRLEERFMAGEVPVEIEIRAWEAIQSRTLMLSPEFCRWTLNHWNEKTFDRDPEWRIRNVVSEAANYHRRRAERGEAPLPEWITEAEILTRDILIDKERSESDRIQTMEIYARAAGEGAAELIETIILDETDPIRAHAAGRLHEVSPRSELYARLLPEYGELPLELQRELVQSALTSPEAPESDNFIIAALIDPDIYDNHHKETWLFQMRRPETPALRDFLTEIRNDPQLGRAAGMVLNQWDAVRRHDPQQAVVGTVQPPAVDFDQIIAGLDGEAAWSEKDTVNENLIWYALPVGPALADSEKRQVRRFQGIFGYQNLTINAIAFGEDKVWLGADKGLLAWDRKTESWTRFAVGGEIALMEAPVAGLEVDAETLRVTMERDGARLIYEFNLRESKWRKVKGE